MTGEFPGVTSEEREAQIKRIPHWPAMVSLIRRCIQERPADRPTMSSMSFKGRNMIKPVTEITILRASTESPAIIEIH